MRSFWFGIVVSCSRFGSSINFIVTPILVQFGVVVSVWNGFGLSLFSFFCSVSLALMDYFGRRYKSKVEGPVSEFHFLSIVKLKPPVWILFLICMFFYGSILSFYTIASSLMQNTGFLQSSQTATNLLAIPNVVSIFCGPYFGWLVDRTGRTLTFIFVASILVMCVHIGFLGNVLGMFFCLKYV